MKRYFILFLFILLGFTLKAQNQKVSITFQNTDLTTAIKLLENKTTLKFYYVKDWLQGKTINKSYSNTPLREILDDIFNETPINYFFIENKIILTQNSIIYDRLPEGFFENVSNPAITNNNESAPVFITEDKIKENTNVETVRIGKEQPGNKNKRFQLSGVIVDAKTNEPVSNASIVNIDTRAGTTSNFDGYYKLDLKEGFNNLEVRSLGYASYQVRVVLYNEGSLNITLNESFEQLGEVVIDSKRNENLKNASTGVTQIDVKEIKNIPLVLGERDILKVATTLPGISTVGEGSAGFNVRGGNADQNLILLDDGVIYNPAHFFGLFSAINPFTTGGVNIYKGNIPAEYGGRLSSVFDLTTKDANTEKLSGEASIGPVTSSLSLEVPLEKDKGAFLIGGRTTYSDWILRSLDEETLRNSTANFFDIVGKLNYKLGDKTTLKATGYYSKDAFSITSDSIFGYSNRLATIRVNHNFNDKNNASFILANSNYRFNIDYNGTSSNDFNLGYNINETEFKVKLRSNYSEKHKFDYGISTKLYNVAPGTLEPINNSIVSPIDIASERGLESAIFISDDFTVNDKLLFIAGLRYSNFLTLGPGEQRVYQEDQPITQSSLIESNNFNNNEVIATNGGLETRLSARYLLNSNLAIKASYNNTFQYIHTLTNNTTVSPTDTYKLTDNNIKPQQARQYSLGLYRNSENNKYEISVEGYFKQLDNLLDFKTGAQFLLNETVETEVLQGEGQSYGIEFLLRKNTGKFNGWISYTYARSFIKLDSPFPQDVVNNGDFFPTNFDKPHDFSAVTNYKLTKRFSISANFVYQTGRPITYPVGSFQLNDVEYVLYSDRNQFRIPDFYRLDLSLNIEGNHKIKKFAQSFWNISVYNVLGRNNPFSVFFVTENGDIKAFQSSIFAVPVPTITYNFKF